MNPPLDHNSTEPIDLTGLAIGDYELIRRLGRGGMADVYLAHQNSLNRQVAIKTLKSNLASDKKYVERFEREAKAAAALNQPNIVQIYFVGEEQGIHFIVQEYIRGQNLKQYLQRHSVVEPILAINVIRQVSLALQAASEQGVIHRDIKPENIMLTPTGDVKVTDFGLARVSNQGRTDLTQVGITMGTPLYMSPEQLEGQTVDVRSDIYSLGITAFHMLVGRPPFEGDSPLTLAVQHVKKSPPPLSKLRPDLSPEFIAIVEKMIAKKPSDRFQSPSDVIKSLRRIEVDSEADWEKLAERLQTESTITFSNSTQSLEVTRQLESVMLGHLPKWWETRSTWFVALSIVIFGTIAGILLANLNAPKIVQPDNGIPAQASDKQQSVEDQYTLAYFLTGGQPDSERGPSFAQAEAIWKKVREYFPPGEAETPGEINSRKLWCRRADERLGELYIRNNMWDEASKIYTSLSNVEESEKRFRTVGLAGQAVVFGNEGNDELARQLLFIIEPDIGLLNDFLRAEIEMLKEMYYSN